MSRQNIVDYIKKSYQIDPTYPWQKYPNYATFNHILSKKWFAVIMSVSKQKRGEMEESDVDILNVKVATELVGNLRQMKGIYPAYHMNKNHWISILLDGSVSPKEIHYLIDCSYDLTL